MKTRSHSGQHGLLPDPPSKSIIVLLEGNLGSISGGDFVLAVEENAPIIGQLLRLSSDHGEMLLRQCLEVDRSDVVIPVDEYAAGIPEIAITDVVVSISVESVTGHIFCPSPNEIQRKYHKLAGTSVLRLLRHRHTNGRYIVLPHDFLRQSPANLTQRTIFEGTLRMRSSVDKLLTTFSTKTITSSTVTIAASPDLIKYLMGRIECNDDKAKKVRRPVFVTTPDLVVSKSPATGILGLLAHG